MASAVRVILRNPLYCGRMRWNVSQFVREPDTGKHERRVLAMLPRAAELYREQIDQGLGGDYAAAAKARVILRDMLGEIMLSPGEDGSLWAEYAMQPAALLIGAGTGGRDDPI